MWKRKGFWIGSVIGLAVLGGAALFAGCRHSPEDHAEWIVKRVSSFLDLNDLQKQKLNDVKTEILADRLEFHKRRGAALDEIIKEVRGKELDETKLGAMIAEHHALVDQIAPRVLAKVSDFHKSLNDEQKEKIARKLEKIRDHLEKK